MKALGRWLLIAVGWLLGIVFGLLTLGSLGIFGGRPSMSGLLTGFITVMSVRDAMRRARALRDQQELAQYEDAKQSAFLRWGHPEVDPSIPQSDVAQSSIENTASNSKTS
jgi:hypothetical protein